MPEYNESMTGGVEGSGLTTVHRDVTLTSQANVQLAGSAIISARYRNSGIGNLQAGGSAGISARFTRIMTGGVELDGITEGTKTFDFTGSGGVELAGTTVTQQRSRYFPSGGEIETSGSAICRIFVFFEHSFYWNINQELVIEKDFYWSNGEQPLRWYRVQGCCAFPTAAGSGLPGPDARPGGCDVIGIQTDDTKCLGATGQQQFVQNILARTVADVCIELTRLKTKWQICSIKRWSRPADPTIFDPASDECNVLEEIPYQELPECLPFALQTDAITFVAATTTVYETYLSYDCACPDTNCTSKIPSTCGLMTLGGDGGYRIKSGGTTPTVVVFDYFPDGTTVVTGGTAEANSTWDGNLVTYIQYTGSLDAQEWVFTVTDVSNPIVTPTGTIATACGTCSAMPNQFYLQHNIENPSIFYNFLIRNKLSMPKLLPMLFNERLGAWVSHLHFVGISDDNANDESWRFSFEFGCPDEVGGESLGRGGIKFSLTVVRKNLVTGIDFDTRILILFPADDFCASIRNFADDFVFQLDTKTTYVSTDRLVVPQSVLLYDKIGLFKSTYWTANPSLRIRMSSSSTLVTTDRKDISGIFPSSQTLLGRGLEITRSPIGV